MRTGSNPAERLGESGGSSSIRTAAAASPMLYRNRLKLQKSGLCTTQPSSLFLSSLCFNADQKAPKARIPDGMRWMLTKQRRPFLSGNERKRPLQAILAAANSASPPTDATCRCLHTSHTHCQTNAVGGGDGEGERRRDGPRQPRVRRCISGARFLGHFSGYC